MYSGDHSLTNLVSGCPVLDELSVERNFDRMVTFKVSSVSLKRLRITFTKFSSGDYKVAVDAPNLEYLYVYDNMTNHYSFTNSLSLIEADIHHDAETIPEIIPFLSSAKTLKLTCHASWDLDLENVHGLNLPMFPNLVRLVTGWGLNMLPVLLNNMPNLEHITFLYGERPLIMEWNPPAEPPVCLRLKMKEIIIQSEEHVSHVDFVLKQAEFTLLRYLLKHSDILETFRINARKIELEKHRGLHEVVRRPRPSFGGSASPKYISTFGRACREFMRVASSVVSLRGLGGDYTSSCIDRVISTTSVSKQQLKHNRLEDRVNMHKNSKGKKQQVEDHRKNFMFYNNKISVTACNDSLNAKTSNVNFVYVTCGKCVLNDNHDMCVLHYINGVITRTKQLIFVPISTREPKRTVNQSVATPLKKTIVSESTNQKPRSTIRKQYEHVSETCKWWYSKITPPGYKWNPKTSIVNVTPNVSMPLGNKSRTTNISESIKLRRSTLSNTSFS
ncbi:integrase, catalytic region, zinc finger, CCHC-type containing protein [Tanacetum coccineum]